MGHEVDASRHSEARRIDDHFELSDEYALKMRLRFAWPDIIPRTV